MDALSKLQEKNKIHSKHQRSTSWNTVWMFCLLSPLLFSYGYEFYFSVIQNTEFESIHPAIVLVGSLGFGLPLAAMGDLMLFKRVIKLLLLIAAESWFIWFWVVSELSWLAFLPLIPVFVMLQIQLPKIKAGE
ncbi:hypothetical protein ACSSVW_003112 [Pseudoalteromonas sp. MBR-15]|jgi:hypothetical protein|uniref:hypothetical protein n=1 Tax=Pseudoalteromonas lipolytica TaxID=570156 RepID=UPI003BA38A68